MEGTTPTSTTTELHILNAHRGHKKAKEVLTIESPIDDRRKFARKVTALLRDGYAILYEGRRITGYDPKTDEWITKADRKAGKKTTERVSARGAKVNAAAPIAGG